MPNLEALLKWAEHVRHELATASTITVKPVADFDDAPATAEAPAETPAPETPAA